MSYATKEDLVGLGIRCGYSAEEMSSAIDQALDELSWKPDQALTAVVARVAAEILLRGRRECTFPTECEGDGELVCHVCRGAVECAAECQPEPGEEDDVPG